MSVINYLPERSEYSEKLAAILMEYEDDLYVVGSAARKVLYGLKLTPKNYNFVISSGDLSTAPEIVSQLSKVFWTTAMNNIIDVDCEVFDARIVIMPIDEFLRTVRFAGDGLAVYAKDGRPIVIPEYMTMPPVVQIIKVRDDEAQGNKEWVSEHLVSLTKFQDELFAEVNRQLEEKTKPNELIDAKGN